MTWKVEFLKFEPQPENLRNIQVRARFFNSVTNEELLDRTWAYDLTYERAVAWARANLQVLAVRDTALADLAPQIGPVDVSESPEAQAEATQLTDFLDKLALVTRLKTQAAVGIITADDQALPAAQIALKAAWKPEFSGKTPIG